MNRFSRFFRAVAFTVAVTLGLGGIAGAATYNLSPAWLLPDLLNQANLTYLGTLLQFGTATGAPAHLASGQTTAPALTSCGTSPAIVGTDTAGTVTMGTGTPTGCVITFNVAYVAAPHCVVQWIATPLASQSYATSTTAITLTQTATSSNVAKYMCVGQAGG